MLHAHMSLYISLNCTTLKLRSERRYAGAYAAHWEALSAAIAATRSLPGNEKPLLRVAFITLAIAVPPTSAQLDIAQLRLGFEACLRVGHACR